MSFNDLKVRQTSYKNINSASIFTDNEVRYSITFQSDGARSTVIGGVSYPDKSNWDGETTRQFTIGGKV